MERGLETEQAEKIFDLIEFFGGYGFNKSHTTAYALVAFQTAYLKAHYPTEFMAALLSSEMDGAEREKYFVEHIDDCRRMGIEVLPPNINEGEARSGSRPRGRSTSGWRRSRGSASRPSRRSSRRGRPAGRSSGSTTSSSAFRRRGRPGVRRGPDQGRGLRLPGRPAEPVAGRPAPRRPGRPGGQEDRKRGQRSLFDDFDADGNGHANGTATVTATATATPPRSRACPTCPSCPTSSGSPRRRRSLGFYMSSHPLARHAAVLQALATHRVADLAARPERTEVVLGGMIAGVQVKNVQKSRSGLTRMAKLTFEDLTGSTPAMLWPEEFAKFEELVKNDLIGFVKGTLDRRRDPAELVISRIIPLDTRPRRAVRGGGRDPAQGHVDRANTSRACSGRSASGRATSTSTSKSSA